MARWNGFAAQCSYPQEQSVHVEKSVWPQCERLLPRAAMLIY